MKKTFKWIALIFSLFFLILIMTPFLFKGKIVQLVKQQANASLNAKFDFKDVDLSLIRNFPRLSVRLEKMSIINHEPFEGDTLIYADGISITLDVMSVLRGSEITLHSVAVDKAVMNFNVTEDGKYSWDIVKPSTSEQPASSSTFKASLKRYSIEDSRIIYNDKSLGFYLALNGLNHSGKGDFTQDLFTLSTHTTAERSDMTYDKVPYLSGVSTVIDADIAMDMKNMKFEFKDNKVSINDLHAGIDGFVSMPDTNIDMDLKFTTEQTGFKTFLSLIPALYSKDFDKLTASGSMKLDGYLKGRYNAASMPGFGMVLKIDNGRFKYPSVPSEVKDVMVDLKVDNSDGVPDHTHLDLSRFHANLSGDVIDARLVLATPVSDPYMDLFIKGKLNLANISSFYPLEKGTELSGTLAADAALKGKLSAIQKQQMDEFSAGGNLSMENVKYAGAAVPKPLFIRNLKLILDTKSFTMPDLDMSLGNTSIKANGSLQNLPGYVLKNELLKGNLNLSSPLINMNDWMNGTTSPTPDSVAPATSAISVPENIDFTLNSDIMVVKYDSLVIKNLKGVLTVRDRMISMNELTMNMMDGSMKMSGSYSSAQPKSPAIDFKLAIKDFDIAKTVKQFGTVEKMAPLAKHCTGSFGVGMEVKGFLDAQMQPVINSLTGSGKLSTSALVISNFEAFNKVADALKSPSWKQLSVPSMNPSFRFFNGRVYVEPFDLTINSYKAKLAGSNGFDQTIDYTMNVDIPRSTLGTSANAVIDNLVATANAKGAAVKVGDVIPVTVLMKGTVKDPKITTDLNRQGAKAFDDLKAAAAAEFEKQKAAAEAKLREEADRLKADAESKLNAEKARAQAELDRMKKEAEAKAKSKADSLKKVAEEEAKKALNNLNPFKKK